MPSTSPHIRHPYAFGVFHVSRTRLESLQARGEKLEIRVTGLIAFATDITPELALSTIERVEVLGTISATPALKRVLKELS